MQSYLAERLNGSRPVRVEVTVTQFTISSAVQRAIIGGGHQLTADVVLVDAKTGETLAARPELVALQSAGQGVLGVIVDNAINPEPIDQVVRQFATVYGLWLGARAALRH